MAIGQALDIVKPYTWTKTGHRSTKVMDKPGHRQTIKFVKRGQTMAWVNP